LVMRGPFESSLLYQGDHKFAPAANPHDRVVFRVEGGRAVGLTITVGDVQLKGERVKQPPLRTAMPAPDNEKFPRKAGSEDRRSGPGGRATVKLKPRFRSMPTRSRRRSSGESAPFAALRSRPYIRPVERRGFMIGARNVGTPERSSHDTLCQAHV
jgi:hypothetical protein